MKKNLLRGISLVLICVFFVGILPFNVVAEASTLQPNPNGFLTPIEPIPAHILPENIVRISTQEQLANIGGVESIGRYFILTNDIHLVGEWRPIENFHGTFDGRGHIIHNLFVSEFSPGRLWSHAGLFERLHDSAWIDSEQAFVPTNVTIKNVGVYIGVQGITASVGAGGLVGRIGANFFGMTITNTFVMGNLHVTGYDTSGLPFVSGAGGLVGLFGAHGRNAYDAYLSISYSYTTGNVSGTHVGGLVGRADSQTPHIALDITNSFSSVNMIACSSAGGLVGFGRGSIANSHATGNITVIVNGSSAAHAGGLVGRSDVNTVNHRRDQISIMDSHATGDVKVVISSTATATHRVGGLVGSAGDIVNSYATGNIIVDVTSGGANLLLGGLVGDVYGDITDSHATGIITARGASNATVGGLAGVVWGFRIENSRATGNVAVENGNINVGGLVGRGMGSIINSYATGHVFTDSSSTNINAGGLLGLSTLTSLLGELKSTTIINSYATGTVTGHTAGGLVGRTTSGGTITNPINISNSHATGNITGNIVGGLVGYTSGGAFELVSILIEDSFATGTVMGSNTAGGLVGQRSNNPASVIMNSHARGNVYATNNGVQVWAGGLVGNNNNARIENSYAVGNVYASTSGNQALAGGLAGRAGGFIENSNASGDVRASTYGSQARAGGLIGSSTGHIERSHATGNVYATASDRFGNSHAGGLVGEASSSSGTILDSNATGNVFSKSHYANATAGGLIGNFGWQPTVQGSFARNNVTAQGVTTYAGGLIGGFTGTEANNALRVIDSYRYDSQIIRRYDSAGVFIGGATNNLGGIRENGGGTQPNTQITLSNANGSIGEEIQISGIFRSNTLTAYIGNIRLEVCTPDAVTLHGYRGAIWNINNEYVIFFPVTPNREGRFTITATAQDGAYGEAILNVGDPTDPRPPVIMPSDPDSPFNWYENGEYYYYNGRTISNRTYRVPGNLNIEQDMVIPSGATIDVTGNIHITRSRQDSGNVRNTLSFAQRIGTGIHTGRITGNSIYIESHGLLDMRHGGTVEARNNFHFDSNHSHADLLTNGNVIVNGNIIITSSGDRNFTASGNNTFTVNGVRATHIIEVPRRSQAQFNNLILPGIDVLHIPEFFEVVGQIRMAPPRNLQMGLSESTMPNVIIRTTSGGVLSEGEQGLIRTAFVLASQTRMTEFNFNQIPGVNLDFRVLSFQNASLPLATADAGGRIVRYTVTFAGFQVGTETGGNVGLASGTFQREGGARVSFVLEDGLGNATRMDSLINDFNRQMRHIANQAISNISQDYRGIVRTMLFSSIVNMSTGNVNTILIQGQNTANFIKQMNELGEHHFTPTPRFRDNLRNFFINCPVDVEVYREGRLVGSIIDNEVQYFCGHAEVWLWTIGDAKKISISGNGEYEIRMVATGNGTMSVNVVELDRDRQEYVRHNFYDISLQTGDRFTSLIRDGINNIYRIERLDSDVVYYPDESFTDGNAPQVIIDAVTSGQGKVIGAGSHSRGDTVKLLAVAQIGHNFSGWYENDVRISDTGYTYNFIARTDRILEARFVLEADNGGGNNDTGGGNIGGGAVGGNDGTGVGTTQQEETTIDEEETPLIPYPETVPLPFADVSSTAWYYGYVRTVWENNIFRGTHANRFSPQMQMTRAMFVQALANLEEVDLTAYRSVLPTFYDVCRNAWYFTAVEWAVRQGIVQGVGNGNFAPNVNITREQMATMLYNYAYSREIELPTGTVSTFIDQANISSWAVNPVRAIQEAGIITGRTDGRFDPLAISTRAEATAIFARFLEITQYI